MLSLTDNLITISYKTKKDLRLIKKSERSIVIPPGIDFNYIQKVKTSEEVSDIIFAGRLIKEKNVDILIKSISIVKEKNPDILCVIVGEGPERAKLEKLGNDLKIHDNIIFKAFMENHDDLIGYMKSSCVFVLPSIREGFGIVVIEANACGVPVIVVDHQMNAAVDLVHEGVNGFKTKELPRDIANNIIRSMENKDNMKESCIKSAKKYDWNKIVDDLEKVYKDIVDL